MKVVALPPPKVATDQTRVVEALEEILEMAKAGHVYSVLTLWEGPPGFSYNRVNMPPLIAIGLLGRVAYRVNKDYDNQ